MNVQDVMTSTVITVRADSRVEDAARLLAHHRISGLPVVNAAGALIGVVTEHDLIAKEGRTVAEIMSRGVVTVSPHTDVEEVAHLLSNHRIRRVPVVEGDRLLGIVSRSDLVRQIAMRWVCITCGEPVRGNAPPEHCPRCGAPTEAFTQSVELPGT
jgi:CBS domain-containing protein